MKHGVFLEEHKRWNTKKIYNRGHLVMTYRYCPKVIRFKSPLVNDDNQHFCGGWTLEGMDLSDRALIQRVLDGKKPMASVWSQAPDYLFAHAGIANSRFAKFEVTAQVFEKWRGQSELCVAVKYPIGMLFDLEALEEDYQELVGGIRDYKDVSLIELFDTWDEKETPLWLTGLLMGYPIENTISLYRMRER
jgi:hypothetical protein